MKEETLALAIEALSWMDLKRINGRLALRRTATQLEIRNDSTLRHAFRLIMDATRKRNVLDYIIEMSLEEKFENQDLGVKNFLRIYTSEAKFGESSYREIIKIAHLARQILGDKKLRNIEDALEIIPRFQIPWGKMTQAEVKALQTFHPVWYVKYCKELLGEETANQLLTAPVPPNYVRLNRKKGDDEKLLVTLKEEGITLRKTDLKHVYLVQDQEKPLTHLSSHRKGLFTVQDKASALAGVITAPASGNTVLDVCAAPGIKTGHLAEIMDDKGIIYSMDFSRRRLGVWRKEMTRLDVKIAQPTLGDARKPGDFPDVKADLVLVDPPCTGTGTFGRVPSGKWRITKKSIRRMANIQIRILENCADHVAENGALVYSTCSITLEENEGVVKKFLDTHPEFTIGDTLPKVGLPGFLNQKQAQRLYPHLHRCNGFYVTKLVFTN